ncbi:MAG: hypothetical protein ACYTDW_17845 [Planctomycetota bacterium]|jgi:uncharacterized membrane protein YdcZ (DUF606 family)
MTKVELIKRIKTHRKNQKKFKIIWLIFLLGIIGTLMLFAVIYIFEMGLKYKIIWSVFIYIFVIGQVPFIAMCEKNRLKKFRLECPNCKALLGTNLVQIAVATGKCGECGEIIIEEEAEQNG